MQTYFQIVRVTCEVCRKEHRVRVGGWVSCDLHDDFPSIMPQWYITVYRDDRGTQMIQTEDFYKDISPFQDPLRTQFISS